jgi:hypothetical protein
VEEKRRQLTNVESPRRGNSASFGTSIPRCPEEDSLDPQGQAVFGQFATGNSDRPRNQQSDLNVDGIPFTKRLSHHSF